jgi:acyl carrier protein
MIEETVQKLLAEALNVQPSQIHPDLAYGDLPEWDSMGHMNVMMTLEEHFAVQITTETIALLTSVPAICAYLKEHSHA